ncbi:MAG: Gram-negative bacterial TonB protein C-terminal [Holophagaceae bacterium]|nr:Gram-negative bacterial TonB protein C-terminal [Holophagaceae bacterium]
MKKIHLIATLSALLIATTLPAQTGRAHKVEQIVLEVGTTPPSARSVQVDLKAVEQEARNWLTRRGLTLIEPTAATESTYHLRLEIDALRTVDHLYCYAVAERFSLLSDKHLTGNTPGSPQRVWYVQRVAGQKGEAGFQENLFITLHQTLGDLLVQNPAPQELQQKPQAEAGRDVPVEAKAATYVPFDFRQIKVRKQPAPPPYPQGAKERNIQGVVVINLMIDTTGLPRRAEAVSGPPELLMTAIRYALKWEFEPAMLNGIPQMARFKLTMPFRLRDNPFPNSRPSSPLFRPGAQP